MERREFAFLLFKEKTMLRHKRLTTAEGLRNALKMIAPSDVYYSCAYYERPEENMETKGWSGADLVFDIDADHIPTPCAKQHDTWTCSNCGTTGHGTSPEKCSVCGGQKFKDLSWPCEICLESAKEETLKLVDVLIKDFGLSPKDLNVAFSGHRGYHVHVESEATRTLDQAARKEIVDYITGTGLEPTFHGLEKDRGPNLDDAGWGGRIAKGTYEYLLTANSEELARIGLKKSAVSAIVKQKEKILENWSEKGLGLMLKGIGEEGLEKIVQHGVEKQSVKIDTVVTTDIHRLIRLANTLHGKTGLKKTNVSITGIEQFDPLKNAIVFEKGALTVFVFEAPQFRLGSETYGPYKNDRVELPTAAALLLLCKDAAKMQE
jgi:DNA primase small subunit